MKIGICGYFSYRKADFGGQAVKTKNYKKELIKHYGEQSVITIDTDCFSRHLIKNMWHFICMYYQVDILLFMPTTKILKLLAPVIAFLSFSRRMSVVYIVIGGWLPDYISHNKYLLRYLRKYAEIQVETIEMKVRLEEYGLKNVTVVPNFSTKKSLLDYEDNQIRSMSPPPYRFCTFSRVKKEKGIKDAILAVKSINEKYGKTICWLDVYGQIDNEFINEFEQLKEKYADCFEYKGIIDGDQAICQLSGYYALLFPTYYQGEGFPGTLVEAFYAGIPVIATNWKYNSEIVEHLTTGFIYSLDDENGLLDCMTQLICDPKKREEMRAACLAESLKYKPEYVLQSLFSIIDEVEKSKNIYEC